MSAQVASFVGRRILKESARNKFGQEDPYFEKVPASRLARVFGKKTQKRRRAVPPGLSANDEKILTRVKRRAYRLDLAFNICGLKMGWGSVLGLIPFAGDAADSALAMMVARDCHNIDGGLPPHIYSRMILNIVFDFVIGLVPFIGDLADALYKCNTRNAVLLENHLREKGRKAIKKRVRNERSARQEQRPVDPSLPEEFDRYEDGILPDPPGYTENPQSEAIPQNRQDTTSGPAIPQPARTASSNQSGRGWFGGRKQKRGDVETGVIRDRR